MSFVRKLILISVILVSASNGIQYPNFKISLQEYKTVDDHTTKKVVDNPEEYNRDVCAEVLLQHWNAHLSTLRISENNSVILKYDGKYAKSVLSVIPTEIARCFLNLEGGIVSYNKFNADVIECDGCNPENFNASNWNYLFMVNFIYSVMYGKYGNISYDIQQRRYTREVYNNLSKKYIKYQYQLNKAMYDIDVYIRELKLFNYFEKFTNTNKYQKKYFLYNKLETEYQKEIARLEKNNGTEYIDELSKVIGIHVNHLDMSQICYDDLITIVDKGSTRCVTSKEDSAIYTSVLYHLRYNVYKFRTISFTVKFPDDECTNQWSITYIVSDGNLMINFSEKLLRAMTVEEKDDKYIKIPERYLYFFSYDGIEDNLRSVHRSTKRKMEEAIYHMYYSNTYGYSHSSKESEFPVLISYDKRDDDNNSALELCYFTLTSIFEPDYKTITDVLKQIKGADPSYEEVIKFKAGCYKIALYYYMIHQYYAGISDILTKSKEIEINKEKSLEWESRKAKLAYWLNQQPTTKVMKEAMTDIKRITNELIEIGSYLGLYLFIRSLGTKKVLTQIIDLLSGQSINLFENKDTINRIYSLKGELYMETLEIVGCEIKS